MSDSLEQLRKRYERERAARLEAERLLEDKADELYESLMQVQSSEALLRSALTSMSDGLLLTNEHHEVILANRQLDKIYPDQAELFKKETRLEERFDALMAHPDYRAMLDEGRPEANFEIYLPGERTISVGVRYTREGFIASTHRDITDLKASEEERRRLLVDLLRAQRMETIGRMSGMIAHDFNNIIASIKGYAGFLEEDLANDPGLLDSAHRIASAANKAEQLIQQILEYGNQQQAPRHCVSLTPVLEDCVDMVEHTLPEGVALAFEAPEEPIWIEANETRLGQLFMNLLTNARRAMEGRSGRLDVHFDCLDQLDLERDTNPHPGFPVGKTCSALSGQASLDRPCVRVTLIDRGAGIEPEVMDRIFEMYFSTRESGTHGGVGMSSVADIVADYGGGIRLTSLPGTGTAVEIMFPRASGVRQPAVQEARTVDAEQAQRACDVLLIDDDENVGEMIRRMLERAGISTEYHSSARRALDLLLEDSGRWKVVISDQIMPELKGSDIYARLCEAGVAIPFIICSAQVDAASGEIHDWLDENFLTKPVDQNELLSKVRQYL
jgi:signal transduction histidine kinase